MQFWLVALALVTFVSFIIMFYLSFDALQYQELGLNYSWVTETIEAKPYSSGRFYLGPGNHFLKFPRTVQTISLTDDRDPTQGGLQGPSLQSRTKDGLTVRLEVSFQYQLSPTTLYEMYTSLGHTYEQIFSRMAIEQLTTAATLHNANDFFSNRSYISTEMHTMLQEHFKGHGFCDVPLLQLKTVHLPNEFEDAIKESQVKQQEIKIARLQQKTQRVSFETKVLQAEQAVKVMQHQAEGEAARIETQNQADCTQFKVTQDLQTEALKLLKKEAEWDNRQLLDYLKIRAMREHRPDKTTIQL